MVRNGLSSNNSVYFVMFLIWSTYTYHSRQVFVESLDNNNFDPLAVPMMLLVRTLSQYVLFMVMYVILFIVLLQFLSFEKIGIFNAYEKINIDLFKYSLYATPLMLIAVGLSYLVSYITWHHLFKKNVKMSPKMTRQVIMIGQWLCVTLVFATYIFIFI
jgi:hypothetical protein